MKAIKILIIVLGLIVCAPLFKPGLYTSHDGFTHLVRIYQFYHHLPVPRWIDELNGGRGYPLFFFVYPGPYYLTSVFVGFGQGVVDSLKLILIISTLTSGIFFFCWLNRLTTKTKSLTATILYLFMPYRFLDLYVRAALGEIVFMALLPLAFYLLEVRNYRGLSLCLAACLLTHLQLSAVFLPLLLIYGLTRHIRLKALSSVFLMGSMLSAWWWLPAVVLLPATRFALTHQFIPDLHRPGISQLLYSPWGFGFSVPGPTDGLSFQLGLAGWAVLLMALLSYFRLTTLARFFWITSCLAVVVMISPGIWLWPPLLSFQFPWRLLIVTSFFLPALSAFLPYRKFIIIILVVLAIYSNRNHLRVNLYQSEFDFRRTDLTATATPDEFKPRNFSSTTKMEFLSHWSVTGSAALTITAVFWFLLQIRLPHASKVFRPRHS